MILIISLAAFVSTFLGGIFALKFKDKLHLILGFSAGAIIGVALFDLLPEAIELGGGVYEVSSITSLVALGFIIYMLIDRLVILHLHHEDEPLHHKDRGRFGAGSLSFHSFLDGVAIGLAFQVSVAVGAVVAIAVLVHDFSDGINTVNMVVKNGASRKEALRWLLLDACAPVLGVLSTYFFTLSSTSLGVILALFCGFFLYIGASDLLPESHHRHPAVWTTVSTIIGMAVLFVAIQFAGI